MRFLFARNAFARLLGFASISVAMLAAAQVQAATEPSGELTLTQAINAALKGNPELAVTSFELTAAAARVTQAGLRPNPEVSVESANFFGTGAAKGVQMLETTLSLSQVIEMGGKRNYRVAAATLDGELAAISRQTQQLDVLAEATQRFIDVVMAQEQVTLAQRATELAQNTLNAIDARVEAARTPEAERSRARIALTRAQIEQQGAQTELESARHALSASWGSMEPTFTTARADLYTLEPVAALTTLMSQVQRNPYVLSFATTARLRDAEIKLARAQARPNLNFSVGVRHFNDTGNGALVAGFSMPLPIYDKNQGAIREAEVRREQTQAQSQAALLNTQATLYGLYQQLQTAQTQLMTLRSDAIPQAEAALSQTQVGYERGRFSYLELAAAQQDLLGLQSAAITAAADYHRLLAEIERLTGEPLAATATNTETP